MNTPKKIDNYKELKEKLKSRLKQLKKDDPMERGFTEIKESKFYSGISISKGLLTFYGNFPKRESLIDLIK